MARYNTSDVIQVSRSPWSQIHFKDIIYTLVYSEIFTVGGCANLVAIGKVLAHKNV